MQTQLHPLKFLIQNILYWNFQSLSCLFTDMICHFQPECFKPPLICVEKRAKCLPLLPCSQGHLSLCPDTSLMCSRLWDAWDGTSLLSAQSVYSSEPPLFLGTQSEMQKLYLPLWTSASSLFHTWSRTWTEHFYPGTINSLDIYFLLRQLYPVLSSLPTSWFFFSFLKDWGR